MLTKWMQDGSFYSWINVWVAGNTVWTPCHSATCHAAGEFADNFFMATELFLYTGMPQANRRCLSEANTGPSAHARSIWRTMRLPPASIQHRWTPNWDEEPGTSKQCSRNCSLWMKCQRFPFLWLASSVFFCKWKANVENDVAKMNILRSHCLLDKGTCCLVACLWFVVFSAV